MTDPTDRPLTASEAEALGLDSTGRDGDKRFPYTLGNALALFGYRSAYVDGCTVCARVKEAAGFGPSHFPSIRCESGKHTHCSCNTCF